MLGVSIVSLHIGYKHIFSPWWTLQTFWCSFT